MIKNKIGIEFEFLLRNKKGNLVFPAKHGFDIDDFPIIGEARAEAGSSPEETLGNFFKEYYKILNKAESKNLTLDLTGYADIDNKFNAEILKVMGTKTIAETKNIYGIDILEHDDSVIKDGNKVGRYISTGLHIHFSSYEEKTLSSSIEVPAYVPVVLLNSPPLPFEIFKKEGTKTSEEKISSILSRITMPVADSIVRYFDKYFLKSYVSDFPKLLKYRQPGFYEIKSYGFEYRSLPFNDATFKDINKIVLASFKKLKELKLV